MPSRVCPDRRCVNYRNPATRPDPPQPPASFRSAAMQAFQLYRRLARHGELSRAVLYPKLFPKQHKCGALLEASTERGLFLAFERGVEDILAGCPFVTVVPPRSSRWMLPARHLQRLPQTTIEHGLPGPIPAASRLLRYTIVSEGGPRFRKRLKANSTSP